MSIKASNATIKLLLFTASLIFFCFSAAAPVSIDETLQRIQQEMEQLKENYDKKIASLEQQLKQHGNLVPPSGKILTKYSSRRPWRISKQESIPVGCIPPAFVVPGDTVQGDYGPGVVVVGGVQSKWGMVLGMDKHM